MSEADAPETIDLSPNWGKLAEYLDEMGIKARRRGDNESHKNYCELADRCENGGIPKSLAYKVILGEDTETLTNEEMAAALDRDPSDT